MYYRLNAGSAFFKIGNSWSVPVIMQLLSPLCELFDRVNYSIAPLEWNWYPLTRQVPTAPEGLGEHVAFGRLPPRSSDAVGVSGGRI